MQQQMQLDGFEPSHLFPTTVKMMKYLIHQRKKVIEANNHWITVQVLSTKNGKIIYENEYVRANWKSVRKYCGYING